MSNFDRDRAEHALDLLMSADNPSAEISCASEATAHALLAIEARLAEIAEQQKRANAIAAFGCETAILTTVEELRTARATVRHLLGLPTEEA